jgi:hypothetical protein
MHEIGRIVLLAATFMLMQRRPHGMGPFGILFARTIDVKTGDSRFVYTVCMQ